MYMNLLKRVLCCLLSLVLLGGTVQAEGFAGLEEIDSS